MNLYNISHFMQIWLLPPGLILLFMLIGLLIGIRSPRAGKRVLIFTFVLFWLLSSPIFTHYLLKPLQNEYTPLAINAVNKENAAIVVLGAGVDNGAEYDYQHSISANTLKRVKYAAYLSKRTGVPIIASGGNRDNKGHTEAEIIRDELDTDYHIKTLAMENKSRTTEDESRLLIPVLEQNHIKRIYLITHAYHMPRSVYSFTEAFKNTGILVVPAPMGHITLLSNDKLANFLPQANALNASEIGIHEYIGLIWYYIRERTV